MQLDRWRFSAEHGKKTGRAAEKRGEGQGLNYNFQGGGIVQLSGSAILFPGPLFIP